MANYGHRATDSEGGRRYEGPETPLICDTGLEIENDITWGVIGENRKRRNQCIMKTSTKNIFFSFDLRSKTGSGEHWRDHATLGDRGYVFYEESPHSCKSYLNIEPVQWQAFLLFIFHHITYPWIVLVVQATAQPFYFQLWQKFIKSSVNFYFRPVQNRWCLHIFGMILCRWRRGTAGSTGAGWTTRSRPPGTPGSSSSS